jgi:hypothetical protein
MQVYPAGNERNGNGQAAVGAAQQANETMVVMEWTVAVANMRREASRCEERERERERDEHDGRSYTVGLSRHAASGG